MIHNTTDFDKFTLRPDNRAEKARYKSNINLEHVLKLKKSIEKHNLLSCHPIVVNENYEIIDGQHRYIAAKELGVPIYYIIEKNIEFNDIVTINDTRLIWRLDDYIHYWACQGNENYVKVRKLHRKYNLSYQVILLIQNNKTLTDDLKHGRFVYNNDIGETLFQNVALTLKTITDNQGPREHIHRAKFVRGLVRLLRHPEFDIEIWLKCIPMNPRHFDNRGSSDQHYDAFVEAYNFKRKTKRIH